MEAVGVTGPPQSSRLTAAAVAHMTRLLPHTCIVLLVRLLLLLPVQEQPENLWGISETLLSVSGPAHLLRQLKIPGSWIPPVPIFSHNCFFHRSCVKAKRSRGWILPACTLQSRLWVFILASNQLFLKVGFCRLIWCHSLDVSLVTLKHMITDVKQARESKEGEKNEALDAFSKNRILLSVFLSRAATV